MNCFIVDYRNTPQSELADFKKWLQDLGLVTDDNVGNLNLYQVYTKCQQLDNGQKSIPQSQTAHVLICIFPNQQNGFNIDDQLKKFSVIKHIRIIFHINDTSSTSSKAASSILTQCSNLFVTYNNREAPSQLQKIFSAKQFQEDSAHNSESTLDQILRSKVDKISNLNKTTETLLKLSTNTFNNKPINSETISENVDDKSHYRVDGKGLCVVLKCDSDQWSEKEKAQVNKKVESIEDTFKALNFVVRDAWQNLTVSELKIKFSKPSESLVNSAEFAQGVSSFLMFLIGRFDNKHFFCKTKIEFKKIFSKIQKVIQFSNVPKIVIVQNPFGNEKDYLDGVHELLPNIKLSDDFLVAFSRMDNQTKPSQQNDFVQFLCEQLKENSSSDLDLFTQFLITSCEVQQDGLSFSQIVSTFRKLFNIRSIINKFLKKIDSKTNESSDGTTTNVECDDKVYSILHKIVKDDNYPIIKRGRCVILKYVKSLSKRNEGPIEQSYKILKETLDKFGISTDPIFEVTDYESSLDNVETVLTKIWDDFTDDPKEENIVDCFFLFVFTNGQSAAKTSREDIIRYFEKHQAMFARPKFIFVQGIQQQINMDEILQEDRRHNKKIIRKSPFKTINPNEIKPEPGISISKNSDLLIYFNNNLSVQQTITLFCKVLKENAHEMDLLSMLSLVTQKLEENNKKHRMPYINSTLTKRVLFKQIESTNPQFTAKPIPIKNRGKCLVLNYFKYLYSKYASDRYGTMEDEKKIKETFVDKLKFEYIVNKSPNKQANGNFLDLTQAETKEILGKVEDGKYTDKSDECFVLCYLSHGDYNGELACHDYDGQNSGYINRDDLVKAVSNNSHLKGKPKFIIVQTCQGGRIDPGLQIPKDDDSDMVSDYPHNYFDFSFDKEKNIFFFSSSFPGHPSFRYPSSGSPFIQEFCEILSQNYHKHDMTTIATMVCRQIGYCPGPFVTIENDDEKVERRVLQRQMPHLFSTLVEQLQFETPEEAENKIN